MTAQGLTQAEVARIVPLPMRAETREKLRARHRLYNSRRTKRLLQLRVTAAERELADRLAGETGWSITGVLVAALQLADRHLDAGGLLTLTR